MAAGFILGLILCLLGMYVEDERMLIAEQDLPRLATTLIHFGACEL